MDKERFEKMAERMKGCCADEESLAACCSMMMKRMGLDERKETEKEKKESEKTK